MTIDNQSGYKVEDKLEHALAMLAAGIPLEEVLAEAGDDAGWLRPLLELADEVGEFQQTVSIPGPEASLQRMLSHAEKLAGTEPGVPSAQSGWSYLLSNIFGGGLRLAAGVATALLVFVLAGGTFTLAAQRSLPGEPLYSLKRAGETLQINLARDPDQREQLLDTFNLRRQMEVNRLLAQGQEAQVTLHGRVHTVTADSFELAGLVARVTPDTRINGQLVAGVRAQAKIKVQPPDKVIALSITVVESPLVFPSPSPTPTPTATPGKGQATDLLPTLEPTATPVRSQEADTLPTPRPTSTPRPIPTEDTDFEDTAAGQDSTGTGNENNNSDDSPSEDNDNFDDNDNFNEDEFEDGNDGPAGDEDGGNDNSGDEDDKGDDNSGSNSGSDDDVRNDDSSNDNGDDHSDDDDSSSDDKGGDKSDDNDDD